MPLYFFDVENGGPVKDDTGVECADFDEVCRIAKNILPDLAKDELSHDGNRRTLTVIARDASRRPVYTATLMFSALVLAEESVS